MTEIQKKQFSMRMDDLPSLREVWVPRNMTGGRSDKTMWQLHLFVDASSHAYAAVIFLRTEGESVSVQLVQAKTRVAPLKKTTIPRLELLSCTIGVRLMKTVRDSLALFEIPTFYWTDSTTALAWIQRNDEFGTFVGNRVKEICGTTDPKNWRHVPGKLNPADLPSRGCSPSELVASRWWEGPDWLKLPESEWPCGATEVDESEVKSERKKSVPLVPSLACTGGRLNWMYERFSSYRKNVHLLAYVLRFVNNARKLQVRYGPLTVEEVEKAELKMFEMIQSETLQEESGGIGGVRVKRMLGKARLTYEEMNTMLCEAEAVMNGRPLTYVTEDLIPLTPSMFLQDKTEFETPEIECPGGEELRRRLRFRKTLKEELRGRFRKEYLGQLVQRGKDPHGAQLKVGDVVLVGADNVKRLNWPMARVMELIPGKDGNVRVARVKTPQGYLVRPVPRLFPLEVSSASDPLPLNDDVKKVAVQKKSAEVADYVTRSGRKIQKPDRLKP